MTLYNDKQCTYGSRYGSLPIWNKINFSHMGQLIMYVYFRTVIPSIHLLAISIHLLAREWRGGTGGGLAPIPAVIGREAGYTLDRSPVNHRDDTQRHTYS